MTSPVVLDLLLVVSCVFSVLLAISYLFYYNRLMALLVGYLLHYSWWIEGSDRIWVSLESIQFSLMSGRIMIKDLRYHSSNQSFRAVKCRVTWRYWLWRARSPTAEKIVDEIKGTSQTSTLPSRLHISLEGVEWRLYNRTASYNDILSRLQEQNDPILNSQNGNGRRSSVSAPNQDATTAASARDNVHSILTTLTSAAESLYPPSKPHVSSGWKYFRDTIAAWVIVFKPNFHEMLPIDIVAHRGAVVFGNTSTPSLLVAKFSDAQGSYSIHPARSSHDKYKTRIDAKFKNVKFDLERNHKHAGTLLYQGRTVSKRLALENVLSRLSFTAFNQNWDQTMRAEVKDKMDDMQARLEAGHDNAHINNYAIVETVLETPQFELSYYWDEPGAVPVVQVKQASERLETHDVGNGDLAPQFGIDLVVNGGTVRYGPWADRQRFELQRLFFPPTYRNIEPTVSLKPGDTRIYTDLKIFIELRDTTTFHIPFKEPSKDWLFDGVKFPGSARKRREAGWLEVHAGGNSTINYVLPWTATKEGFDTLLELHLDDVTVLSSVNDIRLLSAQSSRIICELPAPLRWNDPRQWRFGVSLQAPKLHLLRDHINLLTDLGKDWSSGPPSDFDRWIPMHYVANVTFQDFEINLYLNEHNIITHPHARDANTLLTLHGKNLRSGVEIPSTVFRPQHTSIPFWIESAGVNLSLTVPKWNTHSMFASSRTTDFGRIGFLRVNASFSYHFATIPEYIDQLKLDIVMREIVFLGFGWVVRQLMIVRDNYFGNFTHFSTLREYVTKKENQLPVGDPVELKWQEGKSNLFEVSLSVLCEQSVIVLPAGLTGYEYSLDNALDDVQPTPLDAKGLGTSMIILQPELEIYLRTHDYSMEMSLNICPITLSVVEELVHDLAYQPYLTLGRQKLQVDGINILTNRLFGPQPRTATYLCLWEFHLGSLSGVATTAEIRGLAAALSSFRVNFIDAVNAPASEFALPPDPDVTFLKITLDSLDIAWVAKKAVLQLCIPRGLKMDYSDLAGKTYKKVTEFRIPSGAVRILLSTEMRGGCWLEAGSVSFDAALNIYSSPPNWQEASRIQTAFVAAQDALTCRAWFLYQNVATRDPSAYQASMFLPHPTLPTRRSRKTSNRLQLDNSDRKQGRPLTIVSILADSDEDERISEADRDARIANSRPSTPLFLNIGAVEDGVSSSDESDNNDYSSDLSDSDSDDTDQSQPLPKTNFPSMPIVSDYRHIVRRFESHMGDTVIYRPLFTLARDVPLTTDPFSSESQTLSSAPSDTNISDDYDPSLSLTSRILRSTCVDALITPLCLMATNEISDEIYSAASSFELLVDSLTKDFMGAVSPTKSKRTSSSKEELDAGVSTFRLRILQSLMAADEALSPALIIAPSSSATPIILRNSRIVSDLVITLSGLDATFSYISSPLASTSVTFRGALSQIVAYLDTSMFHFISRMNRSVTATRQYTLMLDRSTTATAQNDFHFKLGDVFLRFFGNASFEMVTATLDNLIFVFQEAQKYFEIRSNISKDIKHHQLLGIMQSCRHVPIGDPLTQSQPSFLIQTGRPERIRYDASWKLFMYLRHCLRLLDMRHRKELMKLASLTTRVPLTPQQMNEVIVLLHERISEWAYEQRREEIAQLLFLEYCFGPTKAKGFDRRPGAIKPNPSLTFHCGVVSFSVFEHQLSIMDASSNAVTFGPVHLSYQYRAQTAKTLPTKISSLAPVPFVPEVETAAIRCHVISVINDDIRITIHPNFMVFLQRLLPLHGKYFQPKSDMPIEKPASLDVKGRPTDDYWQIFLETRQILIQAAVEGMVLELGISEVMLAMPVLHGMTSRVQSRSRSFTSGSGLLNLTQLYTRVRQARDKANPFSHGDKEALASLVLSRITSHLGGHITGDLPHSIHAMLAMESVVISVPRSALLTYQLIEEWRTQYLPNLHVMTQELLLELQKRRQTGSKRIPIQPQVRSKSPTIDFQFSVQRIGLLLQVMHGTWLSWDVHKAVGFFRTTVTTTANLGCTFGVQLASQLIRIGARPDHDTGLTLKTIKIVLPSFQASGNYDGLKLRSHAIIDHFSLTLKPKYMDDILVVQHNLGAHFYDVLDLISENRSRRPAPRKSNKVFWEPVKYDVAFMLSGFRIGIEGPTSTLYLTSAEMTGTAKNNANLAWDFSVSNLALALSHHSAGISPSPEFDRSLRSAYMVLDVKTSSSSTIISGAPSLDLLHLQVSRMHAVMSPNSIGELGDLIDHVQAEMHLRQEQRALELQEIKKKTERVIRAFDVQKPSTSLQRSSSFLDKRMVLIEVGNIGVAFPLALTNEIEVDAIGSVPAFLMSIKSASFFVKRNQSGQASMGRLSFQFVKQFDLSQSSQFDGDRHQSRNKLLYPEMKAEFRSWTSLATRLWQVAAQVDGFNLDLDPAIVDNVFNLITVYRRGKERVDKLTRISSATKQDTAQATATATVSIEASYHSIKTSHIIINLMFQGGKLCLRGMDPEYPNITPQRDELSGWNWGSDTEEIIIFPIVTVWGEYHATPASTKLPSTDEVEHSALIFRSQVYPTNNKIRPSIFAFLIGFTEQVEDRLGRVESESPPSSSPTIRSQDSQIDFETYSTNTGEFLSPNVLGGIQISFSLRIDSSRLELDCGYGVGVVAALHWESGGFIVVISPMTRTAQFAGTITGLKVDLRHIRHQAGTVQTGRIDARNLAFSVSYSQIRDLNARPDHLISVVLDTEFGAELRLDRLQDLLIFKAIYIDRLPGTAPQSPAKRSQVSAKPTPGIPGLTTLVLIRARHIELKADLGHNIASAVINLEKLVFQSRLAGSVTDFSVFISQTNIDLQEDRPLHGYMRLPDFSFTTARRCDVRLGNKDSISKMLDVTMGSGPLDIVLQSEKRMLLQYHAEPFEIRIADDWTAIDWRLPSEERTLCLDFSIMGKDVLAIANLQSIPRTITLLDKLKADIQVQRNEARNSLAGSSIAHLPKPESDLTDVADAMIRLARSKFRDAPNFSYTIIQRMTLRLSSLRLALFKTPNDGELALFKGKDVHAELERIVHSSNSPPSRTLRLAFSSLYLSKYSSLKYRAIGDELMAVQWLERLLKGASEWTIARVPAMNLEMNSDVTYEGRQEILHYDLVATPDEYVESSSSIYVSLNLSLYIWAGALVKGLGTEIDKALASSGLNQSVTKDGTQNTSIPSPLSTTSPEGLKSSTSTISPPLISPTSMNPKSPMSQASPLIDKDIPLPRKYHARSETSIDYGTIQQLGEATPDAKAPWLGLEETVPPRIHEYATLPMEALMKMLLEVYNKQLKIASRKKYVTDPGGEGKGSGNAEGNRDQHKVLRTISHISL